MQFIEIDLRVQTVLQKLRLALFSILCPAKSSFGVLQFNILPDP
jgi:hypothetical protein